MVAASGSRASRDATLVAADLARAWGASLRIVHVVPPAQYKVGRLAPTRRWIEAHAPCPTLTPQTAPEPREIPSRWRPAASLDRQTQPDADPSGTVSRHAEKPSRRNDVCG
jgi:nucleotide-binding universal stress UspA family protein